MPIYEYRCRRCGKQTALFLRTIAAAADARPQCPHCHSDDLRRLVSRVAVMASAESRIEDLADPSSLGDVDENDPRSVARWMRRMGQEAGEDLGPEFGEVVDRLEAGESPEDIEGSMPELGAGDDAGEPDL